MAFGKNKDEYFQRITAVAEPVEEPEKKKKKKKGKDIDKVDETPVQDTSMWSAGDRSVPAAQHFSAPAQPVRSVNSAEPPQSAPQSDTNPNSDAAPQSDTAPSTTEGVRKVGSHSADSRPEVGYSSAMRDEDVTGGLYSDSGRTVTMAMRLISYLFYICGPLFFIGKIFKLIGMEADEITTGIAVSTVIEGVIGCVLLVSAGFLVVALIKILQNLMALQKKKRK